MSTSQVTRYNDDTLKSVSADVTRFQNTLTLFNQKFKFLFDKMPEDPIMRMKMLFVCLNEEQSRLLLGTTMIWFQGEGILSGDDTSHSFSMSRAFESVFNSVDTLSREESILYMNTMWKSFQLELNNFTFTKYLTCLVGDGD